MKVHPFESAAAYMPGAPVVDEILRGGKPPLPEAGYVVRSKVHPNGDFGIDLYPFDCPIEVERGENKTRVRIASTIEAGVLVGDSLIAPDFDEQAWDMAKLTDRRSVLSCKVPLAEKAITIGLENRVLPERLVLSGIIPVELGLLAYSLGGFTRALHLVEPDRHIIKTLADQQAGPYWAGKYVKRLHNLGQAAVRGDDA